MSKRIKRYEGLVGSYHDSALTSTLLGFIDDPVELARLDAHHASDPKHEPITQLELNKILVAAIRLRLGDK